jgi:hypothetical protein
VSKCFECSETISKGRQSIYERKPCLPFVPIDHIKHQTALEHFGFQVSCVPLPFGRFPHAEARFLPLTLEGIVCGQSFAHIIATLSLVNAL